jgi:hypothetical protein
MTTGISRSLHGVVLLLDSHRARDRPRDGYSLKLRWKAFVKAPEHAESDRVSDQQLDRKGCSSARETPSTPP